MSETMGDIQSFLSSLVSWKALALTLALVNLKNLPLGWHVRLFYCFVRNIRWRIDDPFFPKGTALVNAQGKPTHPIFAPYGITSRTPLLETDYNLHKSNSTYFSDLDVARTALATRLYSPGVSIVSKELDKELLATGDASKAAHAHKAIYIALGSVHCSFKREIKPFELYEIESKIIAWDQKWLYIMTFFLRPASGKNKKRTLFATALSKYVVKKGRLTVPPERVLRASGFLPPPPEGVSLESVDFSSADASVSQTPVSGEGIAASTAVDGGSLVREVLRVTDDKLSNPQALAEQTKANTESWDPNEWTYERIDQERRRGLRVVEGWANLDAKLFAEWQSE
ncbi:hypothetical protein MAP00_004915 [Monascus purpureus]|nr:hypothetical protein MAP00_004915 [Monascus purpureus]